MKKKNSGKELLQKLGTLMALALNMLGAVVVLVMMGRFGEALMLIGLTCQLPSCLLPWLLRIAGVVLLIKALLDKPTRWENFMPAVVAFALSLLIGWIF